MGLLRGTALVILGILLLVTVSSANLVIGMERTVMDSGYMLETMDEEDVYPAITAQFNSTNGTGIGSIVDADLIRNQTETAVPVIYDYLHDERDHIVIPVMTDTIQDRIQTVMAQQVRSSGLSQVDPQLARMAAGPQQYTQERQQFRQEQYQRFQDQTEDDLSREELAMMFDAHRSDIRTRILTNDSSMQGVPESVAGQLRMLKADGLVNASLEYDGFSQRLNTLIGQSMPENQTAGPDIPEQLNLSSQMAPGQQRQAQTAQQAVQGLEYTVLGLPIAALLISGLIVLATATTGGALLVIGSITGLAGLISTGGLVAARTAGRTALTDITTGQFSAQLGSAITGIVMQIVGSLLTQSGALLALGIGLIVAGFYLRRSDA